LEKAAVRALNMAKVRADAENDALKAEEEKIHAEALAAVAFRKQLAPAQLARDEAIKHAEYMAKLRIEEEDKAAETERERAHCEEIALEAVRKRSEFIEQARLVAQQREQLEIQLLAQQQYHLDQEIELAAQIAQRQTLSAEAEMAMRARIEEERLAAQIEQDKIAAENIAMSRAKELIEATKQLREESIRFIEEATEQRIAEEQRIIQSGHAQLQAEQAALHAARESAVIAEQAEQIAVRQHQEGQKLLAQQQARLEAEQRVLDEIEARVKAEVKASAVAEEREIAVHYARDIAQIKAMFAQEATFVAQQLAELENPEENARFQVQITQSRSEVMARRLMGYLGKVKQLGRMGKVVGMISVVALIGLSLHDFQSQEIDTVQSAAIEQPVRPEVKQDDKNVIGVAQDGLKFEMVDPPTYLVFSGLKLTDHLGNSN
jgi:hypothetical protein